MGKFRTDGYNAPFRSDQRQWWWIMLFVREDILAELLIAEKVPMEGCAFANILHTHTLL